MDGASVYSPGVMVMHSIKDIFNDFQARRSAIILAMRSIDQLKPKGCATLRVEEQVFRKQIGFQIKATSSLLVLCCRIRMRSPLGLIGDTNNSYSFHSSGMRRGIRIPACSNRGTSSVQRACHCRASNQPTTPAASTSWICDFVNLIKSKLVPAMPFSVNLTIVLMLCPFYACTEECY